MAFGEQTGTVRKGRGRPKTVSDEKQREMVIAQATALFLKEGYGRTTTDDIAALCRISKRTLYRLFASKTELFAAIVDVHRQSMLALPGDYDSLPIDKALASIFRADIDPAADRERMELLRLVVAERKQFPELGLLIREFGADKSRRLLAEWLERQCDRDRIVLDEPQSAAKILMDMIFGAVAFKESGEFDWPGGTERKAYIQMCIRIFLNGVYPR